MTFSAAFCFAWSVGIVVTPCSTNCLCNKLLHECSRLFRHSQSQIESHPSLVESVYKVSRKHIICFCHFRWAIICHTLRLQLPFPAKLPGIFSEINRQALRQVTQRFGSEMDLKHHPRHSCWNRKTILIATERVCTSIYIYIIPGNIITDPRANFAD